MAQGIPLNRPNRRLAVGIGSRTRFAAPAWRVWMGTARVSLVSLAPLAPLAPLASLVVVIVLFQGSRCRSTLGIGRPEIRQPAPRAGPEVLQMESGL